MSRIGQLGGRLYRGEVSYDFVGRKRRWYAISGIILIISIVALFAKGLDFSVDFKGGAVFQFSAPSVTQTQVEDAASHAGVSGAVVQQLTGRLGNKSWQVQTPTLTAQQTNQVENSLYSGVHATNMSTTPEATTPATDAASPGWRRTHLTALSLRPTGRARIGSCARWRRRSSASSPADW